MTLTFSIYGQTIPKAVALCDAAEHGHVDCIEVLHSFGVSLDEQKVAWHEDGCSPVAFRLTVAFRWLCAAERHVGADDGLLRGER